MKLTTKFNLVLIFVFTIGLGAAGVTSFYILKRNARSEVMQHAGMMMEAAQAIRTYTVSEIRPLLAPQLAETFLPQTVPAYAATQSFETLRKNHPEYSYREATLNPTNPRDRAADWEADVIQAFRQDNGLKELAGVRDTPAGPLLYLARPIQIKNEGCLTCHSTLDAAPQSLLVRYGSANGFGWEMNEIVGAQVVTVPIAVTQAKAKETFVLFMGSLIGIFLLALIILNIMLRRIVVKPVTRMAQIADQVSLGKAGAPEFTHGGKDEVSVLSASFTRMRRSLEKAMQMLDGATIRK